VPALGANVFVGWHSRYCNTGWRGRGQCWV
jgi:hypothetical protein